MLILIEKDPKNLIPREVADLDEASVLAQSYPVYLQMEDGTAKPLAEYLEETAIVADPVDPAPAPVVPESKED